jgi:hypothetical protein
VCIFSTDGDLRAIYQHDRAAFELVSNLETKLGFTMLPGASLVQIVESQVSTPEDGTAAELQLLPVVSLYRRDPNTNHRTPPQLMADCGYRASRVRYAHSSVHS